MVDESTKNAGEQEQEILRILRAKGKLAGRELFEAISNASDADRETFPTAIDALRAAGMIRVTPLPRHFASFLTYLAAYELSWPLWLVVTLVVIVMSTVTLASEAFPWELVRLLAGVVFLIVVPGFSLERLLFGANAERDPFERFALSIGLSLSVVPLVALFLSYTPLGFSVLAITTILASLSLAAITVASYRDYVFRKTRADVTGHAR